MYVSNLAMPKIQMRINTTNRSRVADPNVELYLAWFDKLKKVNLEYKDRLDKFEAITQFTKDLGNVFFVGHSVSMFKDRYVLCEFNHDAPPSAGDVQSQSRNKVPNLVVLSH